jgi:flagellar protein FlaI
LDEIQDERGWSRARLRRELRRREEFLQTLMDRGVSDYRQFTALVNEYYADPDATMDRLADWDGTATGGTATGSDDGSSGADDLAELAATDGGGSGAESEGGGGGGGDPTPGGARSEGSD